MPMSSFTESLPGCGVGGSVPPQDTRRARALQPERRWTSGRACTEGGDGDPGEKPAVAAGVLARGVAYLRVSKLALDDALDDPLVAHLDVADLDLIAGLQLGQGGHGTVLDRHGELRGLVVHHVL